MPDSSLIFNIIAKDQTKGGLDSAAGGFQGFMGKASKFAAVGMVGLAGAFTKFASEARESAQVGRQTEAVVTSTGGAAGVTADQVGNLATALSNKTGADDEAIQSGENLLLTFTNIKNSVGAGNDIFNQASAAAVDMAAAMNGGEVSAEGLKTANIQLGKALNDPIKGITALQKVGVSFTEQQKEQIKTMVEAGDTAGAQKVILAELGKEFGGSAEAAADPMLRLQTILGNTAESLGSIVLPAVGAFADKLAVAAQFVTAHQSTVKVLLIVLGSLAATIWTVNAAMTAWTAAQTAAAAITKAWTAVQAAFNIVMAANPVVLIGIAIIALIAIIVLIATKTTWFQQLWSAAWGLIQGAVSAVFNWIQANWPLLLTILGGPIGAAAVQIIQHWNTIKAAGLAVFNWIKGNWPLLLAILTGPFGIAVGQIVAHWNAIKAGGAAVVSWVKGNWPALLAVLTGPIGAAAAAIATHWNNIKSGGQNAINAIKSAAGTIAGPFESAFSRVISAFKGMVNTLIRGWNSLRFEIPSVNTHVPGVGTIGGGSFGVKQLPYLAKGGNITGAGMAIVGEAGPELVSLNRGAQVTPLRGGGGGGGGGQKMVLEWAPAGRMSKLEAALFEMFQEGVRIRGGLDRVFPTPV